MEIMKEWVRSMFVLILALTFIETLIPSERIQPYIRFIFSLVIMATILVPVSEFLE